MSSQYSYNLNALALQGSRPQVVHPHPFLGRFNLNTMGTIDTDFATPPPDQATLIHAQIYALNVKNNKIHFPADMEERSYGGVVIGQLPKSHELIAEAQNVGDDEVLTYFDNDQTAAFYRSALRPNKRMDDPTVPTSAKALQLHVKLLVKAFKSITGCNDNDGMIKPFRERRHDSKLVECICWNLVKACTLRSRSDEPLLSAYDPSKAKNAVGIDTFAARFDAVVEGIAKSKTVCKHLYDAPFISTYVDDPVRAIRRIESNRNLNKLKADVMAKGKAIQKAVNGSARPKTRASTRKRNAEGAELDDYHSSPVQTPPTAQTHHRQMAQTVPAGGRVTRRMSRMMANTNLVVDEGSPLPTPSTTQAQMTSSSLSPLSTNAEVKGESSPFGRQQAYNMHGYAGMRPMGVQGNGYDTNAFHGTNFPGSRAYGPSPMPMSYGPSMVYPYQNGVGYMVSPTGPGAPNGMHYGRSPMAPKKSMFLGRQAYFPSTNPAFNNPFDATDVQGHSSTVEENSSE